MSLFIVDPCCGSVKNGVIQSRKACMKNHDNPCFNIDDGQCEPDVTNNGNFVDLMQSGFNVSCQCDTMKKGTTFSNELGLCIGELGLWSEDARQFIFLTN